MYRLVIVMLIAAASFVTLGCGGSQRDALHRVDAEDGDVAVVEFTARLESGELVATTRPDVAEYTSGWAKDVPHSSRLVPEAFIVGTEGPFEQIGMILKGKAVGDYGVFRLSSLEKFGKRTQNLVYEIKRNRVLPRTMEMSIADFVRSFNSYPSEGYEFKYGNNILAKVKSVGADTILLGLSPFQKTIMYEYGKEVTTVEGDSIMTHSFPTMGAPYQLPTGRGYIVGVQEDSFMVDGNHPLAEKPVIVEYIVKDLISKDRFTKIESIWSDNIEAGFTQSAESVMPLVLILHSEGCISCEKLFAESIPDPRLQAIANRAVWVHVDGKKQPEIASKYEVKRYPTIVIFDPKGTPLGKIEGLLKGMPFVMWEYLGRYFYRTAPSDL